MIVHLVTYPDRWNYNHTLKGCMGWKVSYDGKQFGALAWGSTIPRRVIREDIELYLKQLGHTMPDNIEWITQ